MSEKYREFWIAIEPENEFTERIEIVDDIIENIRHSTNPDTLCYCASCIPRTHVIEKSAADKLVEALEGLLNDCDTAPERLSVINAEQALKDYRGESE